MHNIIKETYCTKTTLRDQNKKERPQYCTVVHANLEEHYKESKAKEESIKQVLEFDHRFFDRIDRFLL